jgi:hypothetical protein
MIGTVSYRFATEIISEAQDLGELAWDGLICQKEKLFESNINTRERFRRELFASLSATYGLIAQKHIRSNPVMLQMVKALNDHVLVEYDFLTLDEFLVDNYMEVPPTYAALSRFIGYTVTEEGTKSAFYTDITPDTWDIVDLNWELLGWENF